jgi:hypothetical protein
MAQNGKDLSNYQKKIRQDIGMAMFKRSAHQKLLN